MISGYQGNFQPFVATTIANGAQESAALTLGGFALCGILLPAAFTGTALTFLASDAVDGTFVPIYNAAGALSYTVAQARFIAIDPKDFQGVQFLKIKSGSTEGGLRTLKCALKG